MKNPYHPLISLDKQDRNILVGRKKDADDFMRALSFQKTRVLILNGEPGVGKSSFLQAELIPKLESLNFPFKRFDLIEFDGKNIIFCDKDPIESIARAILDSNWKEQIIEISKKDKRIKRNLIKRLVEKIQRIKKDYKPEEEVWRELSEIFESCNIERFKNFLKNRVGLSDFLCLFSFYSPYTKVLIFDHVERLFYSDTKNVNEFLEGIRYFSKYDCDVKIILSIRAEFLAPLRYKIYSHLFPENIRDVYLNDIEDEKYLIEAIEKPCSNAGCSFLDDNLPKEIVQELKRKKINNVSVLPILHIVCFKIFENMRERVEREKVEKKGGEYRIDQKTDFESSGEDKYVHIISSFLMDKIKNICEKKFDNFEFNDGDIKNILYNFVDFNSKRIRMVEKDRFVGKIRKELGFNSEKAELIIFILSDSRIIVQAESRIIYLVLSHDLFSEAIVFFKDKSEQLEKTGLVDVFENKRDPGIEKAMINILNNFKIKFKEYPLESLRIASVVGKQFFHENKNIYKQTNELLEILKKDKFIPQQYPVKVLIIKPFSKLFLYRAESEIGLPLDNYYHNVVNSNVWNWKENRIFADSSITIARLKFLIETYKNIIDVRLSDFMPISILSYMDQTVFNPYTFAAHERKNEIEEWCGALPTYHHTKKSYQEELKDHFDYLWSKGESIENFIKYLNVDDVYKEHKKIFLDRLLSEYKKNMRLSDESV